MNANLLKKNARASWLAEFERQVVELDPMHRGKIDWDSANHFYNTRAVIEIAAKRYVENRK